MYHKLLDSSAITVINFVPEWIGSLFAIRSTNLSSEKYIKMRVIEITYISVSVFRNCTPGMS